MNFNSLKFLIFLPIVLLLYWLLPHKFRWALLLVASYYFYMSWNVWLIFAIVGTTIVSYFAALLIDRAQEKKVKKLLLSLTIVVCIGTLIFFKYFNFLVQSAINFLNLFSLRIESWSLDIILPVGISFYTFQTLSYVIDVYRGQFTPEKHFGYYALFVSYFPQLVAGPIERPGDLLPQLKAAHRFNSDDMEAGLRLFCCGFFRKCVVADFCGIFVNNVFGDLDHATGLSVFIAAALFCIQMYCDFAGYSEIAAGCARMMGVRLSVNFNRPYLSQSYSEFFRRWHITLNRWFTDYLYIPLGGSRKGRGRKILNTLIVFALSGLWHGANWTYLLWGLYAGVWVCIESLLKKPMKKRVVDRKIDLSERRVIWFRRAVMFLIFIPAAIMFRAESVAQIGQAFSRIGVFGMAKTFSILGMGISDALQIILSIVCMYFIYYFGKYRFGEYNFGNYSRRGKNFMLGDVAAKNKLYTHTVCVYVFILLSVAACWIALLASGNVSSFQYFQF